MAHARMNLRPNQNRTENGPPVPCCETRAAEGQCAAEGAEKVAIKEEGRDILSAPGGCEKKWGKLANPSKMSWLPQNNQMRQNVDWYIIIYIYTSFMYTL